VTSAFVYHFFSGVFIFLGGFINAQRYTNNTTASHITSTQDVRSPACVQIPRAVLARHVRSLSLTRVVACVRPPERLRGLLRQPGGPCRLPGHTMPFAMTPVPHHCGHTTKERNNPARVASELGGSGIPAQPIFYERLLGPGSFPSSGNCELRVREGEAAPATLCTACSECLLNRRNRNNFYPIRCARASNWFTVSLNRRSYDERALHVPANRMKGRVMCLGVSHEIAALHLLSRNNPRFKYPPVIVSSQPLLVREGLLEPSLKRPVRPRQVGRKDRGT
jgi:hypothetical protein